MGTPDSSSRRLRSTFANQAVQRCKRTLQSGETTREASGDCALQNLLVPMALWLLWLGLNSAIPDSIDLLFKNAPKIPAGRARPKS